MKMSEPQAQTLQNTSLHPLIHRLGLNSSSSHFFLHNLLCGTSNSQLHFSQRD